LLNANNNDQDNSSNLKGYLFFWSGQLISLLGSNIVQFVLIWWVTVTTESALFLSLSAFIGFAPTIIITPIAGVFIDRWGRKGLLGSVDFLQAIATIALVFLFQFGVANLGIVFGFLAIRGVFQAFQQPAIMALVPIMVPKKHLNRINSVDYLLSSVIFLIGPVVAALLYAAIPMHNILWIDAATFLVAVIPLLAIKIPKIEKEQVEKKEKTPFFEDFKEGVTFIRKKQGLLSLLAVFTAANLFLMPLFTLLNLFVYSTHGGGETQLAFVMAFFQGGTIAGALLLIVWKGFKKKVNGVALGIFLAYVGYLVTSSTPVGLFWFMAIGSLINGLALPLANINSSTIWQTVVPKEKLGRVMSVRVTIAQITAPLGMILSGVIAEYIPITYVFIGSAILGIFCLAISWFLTSLRKVEEDIVYDLEEKIPDEIPVLSEEISLGTAEKSSVID
jgi:DHA3 family macrolide efflux protein-like MFS transporter